MLGVVAHLLWGVAVVLGRVAVVLGRVAVMRLWTSGPGTRSWNVVLRRVMVRCVGERHALRHESLTNVVHGASGLSLDNPRVGVICSPFHVKDLTRPAHRLVVHRLLGKLGVGATAVLDEATGLVRNVLDRVSLAPFSKMLHEQFTHLFSIPLARYSPNVERPTVPMEGACATHVIPIQGVLVPTKNIHRCVSTLCIAGLWCSVQEFAL
mmetsp:Transcript_19689/g.42556  ORF Transcript_19689/g.42556 Transcript_19689/m.42556 type:complete len:209 (+) Transcript_19689:215-841(+)